MCPCPCNKCRLQIEYILRNVLGTKSTEGQWTLDWLAFLTRPPLDFQKILFSAMEEGERRYFQQYFDLFTLT